MFLLIILASVYQNLDKRELQWHETWVSFGTKKNIQAGHKVREARRGVQLSGRFMTQGLMRSRQRWRRPWQRQCPASYYCCWETTSEITECIDKIILGSCKV